MKQIVLAGIAFGAAVLAASAADYYVDAVNGNNTWDGTRSFEDRDESTNPVKGPRKTLQSIVAVAKSNTDVIHAAAGYYAEDEYEGTDGMLFLLK